MICDSNSRPLDTRAFDKDNLLTLLFKKWYVDVIKKYINIVILIYLYPKFIFNVILITIIKTMCCKIKKGILQDSHLTNKY